MPEPTPKPSRAPAVLALVLAMALTVAGPRATAADYSERLDALWDFQHPAVSEAHFRAEASKHPRGSREAVEAITQVARALGLQRRFDVAGRALDTVRPTLARLPARVRVRYRLERGRCENSSGRPKAAYAWFERALEASADDTLPGADYYRVDALHMLAIASPLERQRAWNLQALALADASPDPRTRGWRGPLLNNLGWTMHERGDDEAALAYWKDALTAFEGRHDETATRIARWTVARGLRALGRLDEAEAMQEALANELDAAHAPDGYVFEELALIAAARGDRAAAEPWATKALALLAPDAEFRANEPARLARLVELAGGADKDRRRRH